MLLAVRFGPPGLLLHLLFALFLNRFLILLSALVLAFVVRFCVRLGKSLTTEAEQKCKQHEHARRFHRLTGEGRFAKYYTIHPSPPGDRRCQTARG